MIQNKTGPTGLSAKVENIKTSEKFIVSTAINPSGIYETMVIRASDMEAYIINPFTIKPLFVVNSSTLQQAEQSHIRTAELFEQLDPEELIRKYKIVGTDGVGQFIMMSKHEYNEMMSEFKNRKL